MRTATGALVAAFLLVLTAAPAAAFIASVEYAPEHPQAGDALSVVVTGYLESSCLFITGTAQSVVDRELRADVHVLDISSPDITCLPVVTDYSESFSFADLQAGTFTLLVTEHTESIYEPEPQVLAFVIEVAGGVPVRPVTWDAIKRLYR